jgi:hypothetical protein
MRGLAKTEESLDLALGLALARLLFPLARESFRSRRIRESHAKSREAATELSSPRGPLAAWAAWAASPTSTPRARDWPGLLEWCESLHDVASWRKRMHLSAHEQKSQHVFEG